MTDWFTQQQEIPNPLTARIQADVAGIKVPSQAKPVKQRDRAIYEDISAQPRAITEPPIPANETPRARLTRIMGILKQYETSPNTRMRSGDVARVGQLALAANEAAHMPEVMNDQRLGRSIVSATHNYTAAVVQKVKMSYDNAQRLAPARDQTWQREHDQRGQRMDVFTTSVAQGNISKAAHALNQIVTIDKVTPGGVPFEVAMVALKNPDIPQSNDDRKRLAGYLKPLAALTMKGATPEQQADYLATDWNIHGERATGKMIQGNNMFPREDTGESFLETRGQIDPAKVAELKKFYAPYVVDDAVARVTVQRHLTQALGDQSSTHLNSISPRSQGFVGREINKTKGVVNDFTDFIFEHTPTHYERAQKLTAWQQQQNASNTPLSPSANALLQKSIESEHQRSIALHERNTALGMTSGAIRTLSGSKLFGDPITEEMPGSPAGQQLGALGVGVAEFGAEMALSGGAAAEAILPTIEELTETGLSLEEAEATIKIAKESTKFRQAVGTRALLASNAISQAQSATSFSDGTKKILLTSGPIAILGMLSPLIQGATEGRGIAARALGIAADTGANIGAFTASDMLANHTDWRTALKNNAGMMLALSAMHVPGFLKKPTGSPRPLGLADEVYTNARKRVKAHIDEQAQAIAPQAAPTIETAHTYGSEHVGKTFTITGKPQTVASYTTNADGTLRVVDEQDHIIPSIKISKLKGVPHETAPVIQAPQAEQSPEAGRPGDVSQAGTAQAPGQVAQSPVSTPVDAVRGADAPETGSKVYRYRLTVRPPRDSTVPEGYKNIKTNDEAENYGTVEYDHPLSPEDTYHYSMVPEPDGAEHLDTPYLAQQLTGVDPHKRSGLSLEDHVIMARAHQDAVKTGGAEPEPDITTIKEPITMLSEFQGQVKAQGLNTAEKIQQHPAFTHVFETQGFRKGMRNFNETEEQFARWIECGGGG